MKTINTINIIKQNISDNFFDLEKAKVRSHTRKTKSGKISNVKEYIDSRKKKEKLKQVKDKITHKNVKEENLSGWIDPEGRFISAANTSHAPALRKHFKKNKIKQDVDDILHESIKHNYI